MNYRHSKADEVSILHIKLAKSAGIYTFPHVRDADYIALLVHQTPYPLKKQEYSQKIAKLRNDKNRSIIYDQYPLSIFEKVIDSR